MITQAIHLILSFQNTVFVFFDQGVTFVFLKDILVTSLHWFLAHNRTQNFPLSTTSDNASADYTFKLFYNNVYDIILS